MTFLHVVMQTLSDFLQSEKDYMSFRTDLSLVRYYEETVFSHVLLDFDSVLKLLGAN